ncbi:helix-turn-helix transcriptional regulator [Deinococcota bacterium DY0809b]
MESQEGRALSRAQRLREMTELLRLRPHSVRELAQRFGCSTRTVQRDLALLEQAGEGVQPLRRGVYAMAPKPSSLDPVEALAVHAATRLLYHQTPAPHKHYVLALDKLAAMLPEPARSLATQSIRPLRKTGDDRTLELIARAWLELRYVAFEYRSAHGSGRYRPKEVAVYFIEVNRHNLSLYAIGYERSYHKAVRTWKLSRMRNIHLLADTYEIPPDFSPNDYLQSAWGLMGKRRHGVLVKLRFAPVAAPRVLENDIHGLEVLREEPDGSLLAQVEVGVDDEGFPIEILPWIQSWGPRVEVLEPENLRQRWRKEALTLARKITSLDDVKAEQD